MSTFEEKVARVCRILDACDTLYVVIGGVALSLWGDPRFTYDLDFLVFLPDEASVQKLLDRAGPEGVVFEKDEVLKTFKTHQGFVGESDGLHLDFLVAGTAYEAELFKRRRVVSYHGTNLPLPSPEDLILLKIMAGREKDMMDVKSIALRQGDNLDRGYLEKWVDEFQSKRPDKPFRERLKKTFEG